MMGEKTLCLLPLCLLLIFGVISVFVFHSSTGHVDEVKGSIESFILTTATDDDSCMSCDYGE
jgi:hypothetical protein